MIGLRSGEKPDLRPRHGPAPVRPLRARCPLPLGAAAQRLTLGRPPDHRWRSPTSSSAMVPTPAGPRWRPAAVMAVGSVSAVVFPFAAVNPLRCVLAAGRGFGPRRGRHSGPIFPASKPAHCKLEPNSNQTGSLCVSEIFAILEPRTIQTTYPCKQTSRSSAHAPSLPNTPLSASCTVMASMAI